jgi:hypothetical protein
MNPENLIQPDLSHKRCIVRPLMTKPGQTFNLSGVGYKVAGDGSFHRITEPKPSRKAWKRQQVMERKAERERKRRVKEW